MKNALLVCVMGALIGGGIVFVVTKPTRESKTAQTSDASTSTAPPVSKEIEEAQKELLGTWIAAFELNKEFVMAEQHFQKDGKLSEEYFSASSKPSVLAYKILTAKKNEDGDFALTVEVTKADGQKETLPLEIELNNRAGRKSSVSYGKNFIHYKKEYWYLIPESERKARWEFGRALMQEDEERAKFFKAVIDPSNK